MVFAFEKIMEFTMKIDNLDLAYLVVEVMDKILEFQIFFTFTFLTNLARLSFKCSWQSPLFSQRL